MLGSRRLISSPTRPLDSARPSGEASEMCPASMSIISASTTMYVSVSLVSRSSTVTARAEADPVGRRLGVGQLAQLVQPLVQLAEARLDELLALERGLVFRVLPQVAQLDGLGDGLGEQHVQFVAELVDLAAQLFPHLTDHGATRRKEKFGPGAEAQGGQ